MATIKYTINFFSEWHAGSGLTSGSDLDALVVRDKHGLPYIPGRTLKGLLKEAAVELTDLRKCTPEFISMVFGKASEKPKADNVEQEQSGKKGDCFFSNAIIDDELASAIKENQLASFFYRSLASTAIEENKGIAKKHSLRIMETTIPCVLYAEITDVPDDPELLNQIGYCTKWIKRLGQNRNRGLGRCYFEIKQEEV